MIMRMAEIGRAHGLETLIAPVRPNLKHSYPLTPIERYVEWRRPDGMLLDPWLRTHEAARSRDREGRIRSRCASRARSPSGRSGRSSHSPKAAGTSCLVRSCRSRSTASATAGVYVEPNVWMVHPPSAGA